MTNTPESAAGSVGAPQTPSCRQATVRVATPDDAALLQRIAAETFPLACPLDAPEENITAFIAENLSEASFAAYLADPERELFIAEVDGDAAGYTMVVFGEPADPDVVASVSTRPTAELSKLYVRESHHGAGVAAGLVEASMRAAAVRGVASMWLGVNDQNDRANRFYEKNGFARVGTKRFRLGERFESDFVRERIISRG